jgi:carbon monoxide dehydrogenase subunit G
MKLDGDYVFTARIQDVWDALFDPAVLAAVLPGCEKLELVDGSYVGEIKVKVGPISGKFTGKVDLLDQQPPNSYRMNIDGRGAQGFVQASATIRLESISAAETRMRYESEAQIGGKIATVGQRLVETSAKAIVKQSLEGLHENIKIRAAAYAEHAALRPRSTSTPSASPLRPAMLATRPADEPRLSVAEPEPATAAVPAAEPAAATAAVPVPVAAAAAAPAAAADAAAAAAPAAAPAAAAAAVPVPAAAAAAVPAAAAVAAAVPVPAAVPAAASAPTSAPAAVPTVEYKRADASKLAGAVAKEVAKSLAPYLLLVAVAIGLAVYLFVIR